ncbi:MAG: hypothetical protein ABTQ31_07400 [Rhizobiaceae bacterium]
MSAIHQDREIEIPSRQRLSLRRRSADHPMAMFATVALAAVASAALLLPAGITLASTGTSTRAPVQHVSRDLPEKGPRLVRLNADDPCRGQAWGAESVQCLSVIARESGRDGTHQVRLIAGGEASATTPNIF